MKITSFKNTELGECSCSSGRLTSSLPTHVFCTRLTDVYLMEHLYPVKQHFHEFHSQPTSGLSTPHLGPPALERNRSTPKVIPAQWYE